MKKIVNDVEGGWIVFSPINELKQKTYKKKKNK